MVGKCGIISVEGEGWFLRVGLLMPISTNLVNRVDF